MFDEEEWRRIEEFPNYEISSHGNIYNSRTEQMMRISYTNHGHAKITLTDHLSNRHTRSVALLVANAFVQPPNPLCDQLILLDGDLTNIRADNLQWRPTWFAWKYTRQLKVPQPNYYHNLAVYNQLFDAEYQNIIEAGMSEGLLFDDIWVSTYRAAPVYPNGSIFEVIERV